MFIYIKIQSNYSLASAVFSEITLVCAGAAQARAAALGTRVSHRRALPLDGRRRAGPRAPAVRAPPEEPLLEVMRQRRGRGRRRRRRRARLPAACGGGPRSSGARSRRRAARRGGRGRCSRRVAVPDAGVRRRVARLVRAPPLVLHRGGGERYDLVESVRDAVLPLGLVDLLGGVGASDPGVGRLVLGLLLGRGVVT